MNLAGNRRLQLWLAWASLGCSLSGLASTLAPPRLASVANLACRASLIATVGVAGPLLALRCGSRSGSRPARRAPRPGRGPSVKPIPAPTGPLPGDFRIVDRQGRRAAA